MKNREYYKIEPLLNHNFSYAIIYGGRGNGKSYAVKEFMLKMAFEKGHEFVYLRRYDKDTKQGAIERYFADMTIYVKALTHGKYDGVGVYRGEIYFTTWDANEHKAVKGQKIGYAVALNQDEHLKSQMFPNVQYIDFEEFVTSNGYLPNEPDRLQNLVSTVARHRNIKVFMVGNTISRICPYYTEWELRKIRKQKQGTIDEYVRDGVTIAVEYCKAFDYDGVNMYHGQISESITENAFETHPHHKLPEQYKNYCMVYELLFSFTGFSFVMQLLVNEKNGGVLVYVYPRTKETGRKIERIITDEFSDSPFINTFLKDNKPERLIKECMSSDKICFSDDLTGDDFYNALSLFMQTVQRNTFF